MAWLATVVETPRSFLVGRLTPHQLTAIKSRLTECESYPQESRNGVERRKEVRVATHETAHMKVLQPLGATREIRVLDISRSGLKISLPEMLLPGTVIQIRLKAAVAFAEVRYCTPCHGEFHAGVRFQDVFWTNSTK
jgi:hypothetical protein